MQGSFENIPHEGLQSNSSMSNAIMGLFTGEDLAPFLGDNAVEHQESVTKKSRGAKMGEKLLQRHPDMLGPPRVAPHVAPHVRPTVRPTVLPSTAHTPESSSSESSSSDSESESDDDGGKPEGRGGDRKKKKEAKMLDKQYARIVCGAAHIRNLDFIWNNVDGEPFGMIRGLEVLERKQMHRLVGPSSLKGVLKKKQKIGREFRTIKDEDTNVGLINEVVFSEIEVLNICHRAVPSIISQLQKITTSVRKDMPLIHLFRRHPLTQTAFGCAVGAAYANSKIIKPYARATQAKMWQMATDTGLQIQHFICVLKQNFTQIIKDLKDNQEYYTINYLEV